MKTDSIITNRLYDEVDVHLPKIYPDYNAVFTERDPVQKVKEFVQSGSEERFHFFAKENFKRCGDINVTFVHFDKSEETIQLSDLDKLEKHLRIAGNGHRETQLLTEFFVSQDAYFWPAGQIGMELQKRGLPVNIPSTDPESITVKCEENHIDVIYVFQQSMKDMEKASWNNPQGVPIGRLTHEFGYRIDRKRNQVKLQSQAISITPQEKPAAIEAAVFPNYFPKPAEPFAKAPRQSILAKPKLKPLLLYNRYTRYL